jgi:hypothetical protein
LTRVGGAPALAACATGVASRFAARAAVLALVATAAASPATAQVVPLDGGDRRGSGGPVLAGGRVVFGDSSGRVLRLSSAAPDGSDRRPLPPLSAGGDLGGWELGTDGERLAVRLTRLVRGSRYRTELFAGRLGEPLSELASGLREHTRMASQPAVWVAGDEVIALERHAGGLRATARTSPGSARTLVLPPRADPRRLAVAGGLVAAPVRRNPSLDRAVVVADIATGAELRRIPIAAGGAAVLRLALGTDGSVAFTSELFGIGQVLFWSPAGSSGFAVYDSPAQPDGLALSGRRAAIVTPAPGPAGQRVQVVELPDILPPDLRRLHRAPVAFTGPVHAYVRSLAFDGTHLAWSSDHCQLVASLDSASRRSIPRGPCLRTVVATAEFDVQTIERFVRRRVVPAEVHCIWGPGRLCRVRATAFGNVPIGSLSARVRQGRSRRLLVPVRDRRALRAVRGQPDLVFFCFRMRDPSGRTGRTGVC